MRSSTGPGRVRRLRRAVLKEGLEAGEGAIVAHTKPGLALMREALGPDAQHVTFVDVSSAYTRPRANAASCHQVWVEQLVRRPSLRAVADVQFGLDPRRVGPGTAYKAVLSRSFDHLPAWVVCTYNANGTPTRSSTACGGPTRKSTPATRGKSAIGSRTGRLLDALTPEPRPLSGLRSIGFGRDLEEFRDGLARVLAAEKVSDATVLDMLLAATEIAENAIEHGGGVADVRVGHADGRFV